MTVRWFTRHDAQTVSDIDRSILGAAGMTVEQIMSTIRAKKMIGLVCEDPMTRAVKGYLFYRVTKNGIKIEHIGVPLEFRRSRLGTSLLSRATHDMGEVNAKRTYMIVPEDNYPLLQLLKSQKFLARKVIRDEFESVVEGEKIKRDGILMVHTAKTNNAPQPVAF